MQPASTIDEAHRGLRLLLACWVAFALVGSLLGMLLLHPALRMESMVVERADFVVEHATRVRLGATLLALRGVGAFLACLGVIALVRRLPYQPGIVSATVAACAALVAVAVDASAAYLFGRSLPAAAGAASQYAGELDLPDAGGILGQVAALFEELIGYGRQSVLRDYVRIEALALRRLGVYGMALHLTAAIALYAAVSALDARARVPGLTAATFAVVIARAAGVGAIYASVAGAGQGYPYLGFGLSALVVASLADAWLAAAIGRSAERVAGGFAPGAADTDGGAKDPGESLGHP